jgi:flavin-dependent dehydrogenase
MDDVLIVGAGPAGAVAGALLARAGARVQILDRSTFPRDKLCGDSLNPGTLAALARVGIAPPGDGLGRRVDGMILTGENGKEIVTVEGRYPRALFGRSISRRDLDWALVGEAIAAGAQFESGIAVRGALVGDQSASGRVEGVTAGVSGASRSWRARVTIAADGRRSTLAFGLGLARHPARPRRWAIGAYFQPDHDCGSFGEMHIRRGRYIGVAPMPDGLVNICLVRPSGAADGEHEPPEDALRRELTRDPALRDRFSTARLVRPPMVLGPLAVEATGRSIDGLILAGDAAGFIDPMTGDGLRFAIRGGELAALAALRALEHGWRGLHADLAIQRRREFSAKWRFNRALRSMVGSAVALRAATFLVPLTRPLLRAVVAYAGDCGLAEHESESALPIACSTRPWCP